MFHTENGSWSRGQLNQCQLNLQRPESPHINMTYGTQNIHPNEIINNWCNWTRSYLRKNCGIQNLITGHYGKLWEMSAERQHGYPCQSIKLQAASPHILSKCQANCTLCKYPIQFLGSNTKEQYLAIISSGPNTWDTETGFSRCSRAHWTLFNGATIKLNLHDVRLLLTFLQQLHLIQATLDFQICILSITCFIYTVSN